MVNSGRPSRGCATCKSRRIKCDETRPQCNKCVKAGRECPGVPDDFDLVFRNETTRVAQRAAKRKVDQSGAAAAAAARRNSPKAGPARSQTSSPNTDDETKLSPEDCHAVDLHSSSHRVPPELYESVDVYALNFFFGGICENLNKGNYTYGPYVVCLPSFYSECVPGSSLDLAVKAAAMLSFANKMHTACLKDKAVFEYGKALTSVGAAIRDTVLSQTDGVLMAVLVLAIYELMAANHHVNVWFSHIDGAVALLRHRGLSVFADARSKKLFRSVRQQMLLRHVLQSRPIPPFIPGHDWSCDYGMVGEDELYNGLSMHFLAVGKLRDQARRTWLDRIPDDEEVIDLLERAVAIDEGAVVWYDQLPAMAKPRSIPCFCLAHQDLSGTNGFCPSDETPEDSAIWLGMPVVYIYEYGFVSGQNGNYRAIRILLHGIIIRCLNWLMPRRQGDRFTQVQYDRSCKIIQQMVDEICAGVPCHLEPNLASAAGSFLDTEQPGRPSESRVGPRPGNFPGAMYMVWPLMVAVMVELITETQRAWIRGRLRKMASVHGIHNALHVLKARPCLISGELPGHKGYWYEGRFREPSSLEAAGGAKGKAQARAGSQSTPSP